MPIIRCVAGAFRRCRWLALVGSLLAPPAMAFDITLTDDYVLGESESLITARQLLHQQMREDAVRQAGTYVARQETLDAQGNLSESVDVLTAALITAETVDEQVSVSPHGTPVLTLSVAYSVDEGELQRRIEALYNDQAKVRAIAQLSRRNDQLLEQLEQLARDKRRLDPMLRQEVMAESRRVMASLEENTRSVDAVFGTDNLQVQLAEAEEAFVTDQERAWLRMVSLTDLLNERLETELSHVERRGDFYFLDVKLTGLGDLRVFAERAIGVPFGDHGFIDNAELRRMNREQRTAFFHAFLALAPKPIVVEAFVQQADAPNGGSYVMRQVLLGSARVKTGINPRVLQERPMKEDMAQWLAEQDELEDRLAIAIYDIDTGNNNVRFTADGLEVRLRLPAEHGSVEDVFFSIRQRDWDQV